MVTVEILFLKGLVEIMQQGSRADIAIGLSQVLI